MVVETTPQPKASSSEARTTLTQLHFQILYSFKDEHAATIFHLLKKCDMLKFPKLRSRWKQGQIT